jgi:hypothetical protein
MTMNVLGYAAPNAKAALEPYRFERRDIRSNDVVIEISIVAFVIQIFIMSKMTGVGAFFLWCQATK